MDYRYISEKRKYIFSFLFRLCFYRFSPMFLSLFAYVFIAFRLCFYRFSLCFYRFSLCFYRFSFRKALLCKALRGVYNKNKNKSNKKQQTLFCFFLKAKKEVITTIAAKKYLPIDPKSNEMTKNGSKPYLWHRFLGYLKSKSG